MAIISDNVIDQEIQKMKPFLERLKIDQMAFSNTFHTLRPQERARAITKILNGHRTVLTFIEKAKGSDTSNSGTKFALENIKQTFQTLLTLWHKTEKKLETSAYNPDAKSSDDKSSETSSPERVDEETRKAVDEYVLALQNMGHSTNGEMVNEFKEKLRAAYKTAKERSGGKELSIQIIQTGSKIKVRMDPK